MKPLNAYAEQWLFYRRFLTQKQFNTGTRICLGVEISINVVASHIHKKCGLRASSATMASAIFSLGFRARVANTSLKLTVTRTWHVQQHHPHRLHCLRDKAVYRYVALLEEAVRTQGGNARKRRGVRYAYIIPILCYDMLCAGVVRGPQLCSYTLSNRRALMHLRAIVKVASL